MLLSDAVQLIRPQLSLDLNGKKKKKKKRKTAEQHIFGGFFFVTCLEIVLLIWLLSNPYENQKYRNIFFTTSVMCFVF